MYNPELARRAAGSGGGGGKGGGGGSSHVPHEDPNTLRSRAVVRILEIISGGVTRGLVNGAKSILLQDTRLQDESGRDNYSGVAYETRLGYSDQDYMAGISDAETTISVSAEVTNVTPVVRTYNGPVDAVRITLRIPQLTNQDPSTGDLHGSTVALTIYKKPNGSIEWEQAKQVEITGKTVSSYEVSYRIELGSTNDWDIKIERNTPDSANVNLNNKTFWSLSSIITDGKFIYPNTSYAKLEVDAQQFGSDIPTRQYEWDGILCQVPSNYNAETREYTGIWDGTFQTAWTNNPAWVLYYLLTNKEEALGRYIDATQVDKWSLYMIAQYCDELVDDGFAGQEPRYTFNYQIMSRDDAYKVLQAVASVFLGRLYFSSNLIFAFADMPEDPVKLVTAANVVDGVFTYEGTSKKARHSVAFVTWFDPSDNYRPAIEIVEDKDQIARFGWRELPITAYACTSRGQAHRMGRWALDTERYASETVNYQAGFDHADVMPGNIIEVYDANKALLRLAGRLLSSSSNSVTIDAPITIEASKAYTLKVMMPDGSIASRALTNSAGATNELTFSSALPATPVTAAMWAVSVSDLKPRQFRVLSVQEQDAGLFSISAILHDPTKYARVEQNIKLEALVYTRAINARPTAPTNLVLFERLYKSGPTVSAGATLSWQGPTDGATVQTYEVERRRLEGNWEPLGITNGPNYDIRNAEAGTWEFRVRSINYNGRPSEWVEKQFILFGLSAPPANVEGFAIHITGDTAMLMWQPVADLDLAYYRIKFAPVLSGANWGAAIDVVPKVSGVSVQIPAMVGTYLIKAVDQSGNESEAETVVITTVAALTGYNAVAAVSDWPNWNGSHNGTLKDGDLLKLGSQDTWGDLPGWDELLGWNYLASGVAASGTYTFASTTDLGAVYTSRLSASIDAYGINVSNIWATLGAWRDLETWGGADPGSWGVAVQLRTTQDDPSGAPVWSEWKNLIAGDYTARAFQFRLLLTSNDLNVTPVIADATVTIDMPDRTEGENNVSFLSGGTAVVFAHAFRATPAVALTGQNLQTGDYFEYTSGPSAAGFAGRWKNSSGVAVSRTTDWIAQGYGIVN